MHLTAPFWTKICFILVFESATIRDCCRSSDVSDLIDNFALPTNFQIGFSQYAGYLSVASKSREYFYWFVESQGYPLADPLILWIHNGYACSSLVALLAENGPFKVDAHGETLYEHIYAWNKLTNVLYLELPVGNGFSYAISNDIPASDELAIEDAKQALAIFFERYPQFRMTDLYIAGQNAASVYVLKLALAMATDDDIQIKGAILGNAALVSSDLFVYSRLPAAYYQGYISEELWSNLKLCCGETEMDSCRVELKCPEWHAEAMAAFRWQGTNRKNVYETCYTDELWVNEATGMPKPPCVEAKSDPNSTSGYDESIERFLNNAVVREAIDATEHSKRWSACSRVHEGFKYSYDDQLQNFQAFASHTDSLRMLMYYGDASMLAPHFGAPWFLESLNLTTTSDKEPWHYEKAIPSAAGFVSRFGNIDFVTVKGGGHFTSEDRPREILQLISNFIANTRNYSLPCPVELIASPMRASNGTLRCISYLELHLVLACFISFHFINSRSR